MDDFVFVRVFCLEISLFAKFNHAYKT